MSAKGESLPRAFVFELADLAAGGGKAGAAKRWAAAEKLLNKMVELGYLPVAVTDLPEAEAQALAEKLELARLGVRVHWVDAEKRKFPGVAVWREAVRAAEASPRTSTAWVTRSASCRSAIATGLRVIAAPPPERIAEDFCGADIFLDSPADFSGSFSGDGRD